MRYLTILALGLVVGCSNLVGAPTPEEIRPQRAAVMNLTDVSSGLRCIGSKIDASNSPAVDVFISPVTDDTRPLDATGLLARDTTMMATTALDRLRTDKVNVVGNGVRSQGRIGLQLIGAFTELNRTVKSPALGGSLRINEFEMDLSGDREWNHLAIDMAIIREGRVVPGMTISAAVSVKGGSSEGNLRVTPENDDWATAIALGSKSQEGIHAAQRLVIEVATAVLLSRFYGIDFRQCLKADMADAENFDNLDAARVSPRTLPQLSGNMAPASNSLETGLVPPNNAANSSDSVIRAPLPRMAASSASSKNADDSVTDGNGCRFMVPAWLRNNIGSQTVQWSGGCSNGYLDGAGRLSWVAGAMQMPSIIDGNLRAGYLDGVNSVLWPEGWRFTTSFSAGRPQEDGLLEMNGQRFSANLDARTGVIRTGRSQ